jgi:hypothetical protein
VSWNSNTEDICNNPACKEPIWWNPIVKHPITGRSRPLNKPYYPDQAQAPELHLCMQNKRPGSFIQKYTEPKKKTFYQDHALDGTNHNKELLHYIRYGYPSLAKYAHYSNVKRLGRGVQQTCDNPDCVCNKVEAMKDPIIKAQWEKQRQEWIQKWDAK